MQRLFATQIYAPSGPSFDESGRVRVDDLEMIPEVQAEVAKIWPDTTTENLGSLTDIAGYRSEFLKLFGFGLPGINYDAEIDPHMPME
jgi:enoyl-[acyl-carrier protein] reductase/trans-2-enoyl-CoA reductase (NAD+)